MEDGHSYSRSAYTWRPGSGHCVSLKCRQRVFYTTLLLFFGDIIIEWTICHVAIDSRLKSANYHMFKMPKLPKTFYGLTEVLEAANKIVREMKVDYTQAAFYHPLIISSDWIAVRPLCNTPPAYYKNK